MLRWGQEKFGTDPCNFCVLMDRDKTLRETKSAGSAFFPRPLGEHLPFQ